MKLKKLKFCMALFVQDAGSEYEMNASNSHSRVINSFRSAVYEHDDEKSKILQKLLRSTKPSDLKAANLLIKTMVKEVSLLVIFFQHYS